MNSETESFPRRNFNLSRHTPSSTAVIRGNIDDELVPHPGFGAASPSTIGDERNSNVLRGGRRGGVVVDGMGVDMMGGRGGTGARAGGRGGGSEPCDSEDGEGEGVYPRRGADCWFAHFLEEGGRWVRVNFWLSKALDGGFLGFEFCIRRYRVFDEVSMVAV